MASQTTVICAFPLPQGYCRHWLKTWALPMLTLTRHFFAYKLAIPISDDVVFPADGSWPRVCPSERLLLFLRLESRLGDAEGRLECAGGNLLHPQRHRGILSANSRRCHFGPASGGYSHSTLPPLRLSVSLSHLCGLFLWVVCFSVPPIRLRMHRRSPVSHRLRAISWCIVVGIMRT